MGKKIIKEHMSSKTFTEHVIIPEHEERIESTTFRKAKKKLREDGHYQCWICGSTEDLHVHHFCCESSLSQACDFEKLKEACETFDIYGYGKEMKDIPMESVDDIRNMMVLCREHHININDGSQNGIHCMTFPSWISQKICTKLGNDPIPDNYEELIAAKEKTKKK